MLRVWPRTTRYIPSFGNNNKFRRQFVGYNKSCSESDLIIWGHDRNTKQMIKIMSAYLKQRSVTDNHCQLLQFCKNKHLLNHYFFNQTTLKQNWFKYYFVNSFYKSTQNQYYTDHSLFVKVYEDQYSIDERFCAKMYMLVLVHILYYCPIIWDMLWHLIILSFI